MFTPVYSICISSSKLSRKIHVVSILKKLFEVPNYARYDSRRCQPVKCQLSLRQLKGSTLHLPCYHGEFCYLILFVEGVVPILMLPSPPIVKRI